MSFNTPEEFYHWLKKDENKFKSSQQLAQFLNKGDEMKTPGICACKIPKLNIEFHNIYLGLRNINEQTRNILKSPESLSIKYNGQTIIEI